MAVSGDLVYCRDGASSTKVLMFKTGTEHWKVLPECPKQRFSVAVVNGQLVATGGRHLGKDTSTLLSPSQDKLDISQWKWLEEHTAAGTQFVHNQHITGSGWRMGEERS